MSFRRLCLVACGLLFGAACNTPAEPVPPPPWIISKTIFRPEREWYVSQSIVDAPFFNQMGWMGQGTPAERIRWEVTRQYLIGYRSYPLYYSEDDRLSGLNDAKDPVIAYPILAHYDMFQGQMIQPPRVAWSELPYFSVDWSNPLLTEEGGGPFAVDRFLSYVVEDPQDPDFFFVRDDYIELKHFVSKDEVGVAADPATRGAICDDADFMVCQPSEFTIIRSMFPIDLLDDQYIPHLSPQSLYSFFPHFRKSHALVNPTGVVMEQGRRYFADRMNIWERVRDDNGAEIPWHRREARPVPWYILEGAPPFFHSPVQWAIEQWNDAILEGVNARRYYSCIDAGSSPNECLSHFDRQDTFLLFCPNNPVKAGDPEPCGEPGTRVKKGDLRYNTFTWDTDSTTGSAAGVGWFNVDHKTARIFSSQIYFNSYSLWKHCYTLAFFVKIMNGEISLEEIATSEPYADLIAPYFAIDSDRSAFEAFSNALQTGAHVGVPGTGGVVPERPLGPEEVERAVKRMSLDWLQSPTLPPVDKTSADTIRESVFRRLGAAAERGYLPAPREVQRARESLLHGSDHERAVTDEADFAAAGVSPSSPDSLAQASPLREHPRRLGSDYVVAEPVLGNPFDRTWFTFAQNHVGKTVDEIAEVILVEGLSPLVVHEIGHALGGRHNFAGSYDAMNYPPEYWSVRALDGSIGPRWEDPLTDAEVDAGLLGMQYS